MMVQVNRVVIPNDVLDGLIVEVLLGFLSTANFLIILFGIIGEYFSTLPYDPQGLFSCLSVSVIMSREKVVNKIDIYQKKYDP